MTRDALLVLGGLLLGVAWGLWLYPLLHRRPARPSWAGPRSRVKRSAAR